MSKNTPTEFTLPSEKLLVDRSSNARIVYGNIDELALLLMTEGQLEPVTVRMEGKHYFLVNGHRRHRAFERSLALRIEEVTENTDPSGPVKKYFLFEKNTRLLEAPGPLHPSFDPKKVRCRLADKEMTEADIIVAQLSFGSGLPLNGLEKMLTVARLRKLAMSRKDIILRTRLSKTHVANAERLNAADPRLLDYVSDGRISQKLALRLLKSFSAAEQIEKVREAISRAEKQDRKKILPKDITWPRGEGVEKAVSPARNSGFDKVRSRVELLKDRLKPVTKRPPNKVAADRLEVFDLLQRYLVGKLQYARLEAFLLGRG